MASSRPTWAVVQKFKKQWAGNMAQRVRAPVAKPEHQNLIPQDAHGKQEIQTPESCPLISKCVMHRHTQNKGN